MKHKGTLILVVILLLGGCAAPVQQQKAVETVDSQSVSTQDSTMDIWDLFLERNGDKITDLISPPQPPDMFPLYLEGLKHPKAMIRWYAANMAVEYAFDTRKDELVEALEAVRNDSDDAVRSSAEFALAVANKTFEGERFVKTADGAKAAFYPFYDLQYNNGDIYIFTDSSPDGLYKYNMGGSITSMNWSPDGSKLCTGYGGRIWNFVSVVDMTNYQPHEVGLMSHITKNQKQLGYKIQTNMRMDPYVSLLEWSPNSDKLLLSYTFTDDDYVFQGGTAVYDIASKSIERVMKGPGGTEGAPKPEKPKGFKW